MAPDKFKELEGDDSKATLQACAKIMSRGLFPDDILSRGGQVFEQGLNGIGRVNVKGRAIFTSLLIGRRPLMYIGEVPFILYKIYMFTATFGPSTLCHLGTPSIITD